MPVPEDFCNAMQPNELVTLLSSKIKGIHAYFSLACMTQKSHEEFVQIAYSFRFLQCYHDATLRELPSSTNQCCSFANWKEAHVYFSRLHNHPFLFLKVKLSLMQIVAIKPLSGLDSGYFLLSKLWPGQTPKLA